MLIVDDNHDAADMLADLLLLMGHDVLVVYDGLAGVTALSDFNAQVVLLDIGLPGIDGWEVARRMRQMHGSSCLRIIAVTGYGQDRDRQRSRQAGIDHHLVKPANFTALEGLLGAPA